MKPNSGFALVLIIILIGLIAVGAYFLSIQNKSLSPASSSPPPSPGLISKPSPPDPTANWKVFTNISYKYSLKYPPSYKEDATLLDLSKNNLLWKDSNFFYTTNPEFAGGEVPFISITVWKQDSKSLEKWFLAHTTSETFDSEKIPADKIILYYGVTSNEKTKLADKNALKFTSQTMNGSVQRVIVDNAQYIYEISLWTNNNLPKDPEIGSNFGQILVTFNFL